MGANPVLSSYQVATANYDTSSLNKSGKFQDVLSKELPLNGNVSTNYTSYETSSSNDSSFRKRNSAGRERQQQTSERQMNQSLKLANNQQTDNNTSKPPRQPSNRPMGGKLIAPIDHEKQRQKLQEIMGHLLDEDEESKMYESLNPHKKSLNPLLHQAKQRSEKDQSYQSNSNKLSTIERKERMDSAKRSNASTNSNSNNNGVRMRTTSKPQIQQKDQLSSVYEKQFSIKNSKKITIRKEISSSQSDRNKNLKNQSQNQNPNENQSDYVESSNTSVQSQGQDFRVNGKLKRRSSKTNTQPGLSNQASNLLKKQGSESNSLQQLSKLINVNKEIENNQIDQNSKQNLADYSIDEDALAIQIKQQQEEIEKDLEIRDRFILFSWGLQMKDCLRRRAYFIEAVDDLKRKLRKVLYMWQDKKAEDNFKALTSLIENYDKNADSTFASSLLSSLTSPQPTKERLGGKFDIDTSQIKYKMNQSYEEDQDGQEQQQDLDLGQLEEMNEEELQQQQLDEEENMLLNKLREEQEQEQLRLKNETEEKQKQIRETEVKQKQLKKAIELKDQIEKEEICEGISEQIIEKIMIKQVIEFQWCLQKVQFILKMWILKRRYKKLKIAFVKIQSLFRMKLARMNFNKRLSDKQRIINQTLIQQQPLINFQPPQVESNFNSSFASSIQNSATQSNQKPKLSKQSAVFMIERFWMRFKEREEGRKIREYLKGIPYECRRSYVKYWDLKHKTYSLKSEVDTYIKYR
eukprot:403361677